MTFLDQKRPELQTWTDERVELLKKLWADGLSASQIAGELGGITRNAVISNCRWVIAPFPSMLGGRVSIRTTSAS